MLAEAMAPSFRRLVLAVTISLAALVSLPGVASAGSFHVVFPQQLETTVMQGQSTTFTMDVQAFGAVPCSDTTAPVKVAELYSVDAVGDIAAGQPAEMPITTGDTRGVSDNCYVNSPIEVPLTVTAAIDTPAGDYHTFVPYGQRGSDTLDLQGPPLTIHVTPAQPAAPLPPPQLQPEIVVLGEREAAKPVLGKSVLLTHVKGTVTYRSPGKTLTQLTGAAVVPNGTLVDVRSGVVKVTVVRDKSGALDSVDAWGGTFTVNQDARFTRPLTSFVLTAMSSSSRSVAKSARAARAHAAKSKKKNLLWVNGKGNFKTKGKRASAIVRGTYWLTKETSSGTMVHVKRGLVAVRDFVKKKTVLVSQGQTYTAKVRSHVARRVPAFTGAVR